VKYIDEYRDAGVARGIARAVRGQVTRPWVLMEICGGQTHTIMRYGLDEMLPPEIELVHGPGCPVCVAPLEIIE
jgi:hydrogenase expression/formation protein HypD